jgi:hypothetical protein
MIKEFENKATISLRRVLLLLGEGVKETDSPLFTY